MFKSGTTALALGLLGATAVQAATTFKVPFKSTVTPNLASFFRKSAPLANAGLKTVTTVLAGDYQVFDDVLVDTGSAILWVGGRQKYVPGPYTRVMNETFSVGYGTGGVNGTAYLDRVTVGNATVSSQIIGNATFTAGFTLVEPIDGILGLGPTGSNAREVSGYNTTPTFMDNLLSEGAISQGVFGIYVSPLSQSGIPEGTGEITFGGIDRSKIRGDISWLPQDQPLNLHWGFNASSFYWGDEVLATGPIYARTDTGLLLTAIPSDPFFAILNGVPGATLDGSSAIQATLVFPSNATLPPIVIGIGNLNFTIPPERYIVPKALHSALNITDDLTHTWLTTGGPDMFDLGQTFLENAYSAYDMENHLVGFAHLA